MTNPVGGFDHVIVGVADLQAARQTYQRLGFTMSPRGRHIGWGTANYCIMFGADYIELLGIVDAAQFTNNLDKRLAESGGGLFSVTYTTADADAAFEALKPLGAEPPKQLKRLLELPEGTVEPAFELVHLPPQATPGAPGFVIQHLTREMVWRPEWQVHANGAVGIASVSVRVADPGAAAKAYGKLFGEDAVALSAAGMMVRVGEGELYISPTGPDEPEGPVGFEVKTSDLKQTEAALKESGVRFTGEGETLRVDEADACGAALSFSAGPARPGV
ncbi:MAG: VOC family protein [Rhodospirillales bacterium]|nr:VOC family protein [Rhodospirillales bacterium]